MASTTKRLSATAIYRLARNAGFGEDSQTATQIALAESGGDPIAVGDSGDSHGLWQIDRRFHPEFAAWDLNDPQTNANAAFSVYRAAGFSFKPWSTYNGGQYLAFTEQGNIAAENA